MRMKVGYFAALLWGLCSLSPLAAQHWKRVPCPPCPPCETLPGPWIPGAKPSPYIPGTPHPGVPTPGTPGDPGTPPDADPSTPPAEPGAGLDLTNPLAQASEAGVQLPTSLDATVLGDILTPVAVPLLAVLPTGQLVGLSAGQVIQLPAGTVFNRDVVIRSQSLPGGPPPGTTIPAGQPLPTGAAVTAAEVFALPDGDLPAHVLRGAYKIGENESPRPLDRVYLNYSHYYNVNASVAPQGASRLDYNRYVLGIEKTFLEGDASVGLRVPFLQAVTNDPLEADGFGDISVVLKYAFLNEDSGCCDGSYRRGNVMSGGLVITAPTGGRAGFSSRVPEVHPTVIQPWMGGLWNRGQFLVQGFSSIAVPTDSRDATIMFNSVQFGYRLMDDTGSDGILRSVTPLMEVHVNTPLTNNRPGDNPQFVLARDYVNMNGGVALGIGKRSVLNLGVGTSVSGPRAHQLEAIAQLNFLY